MQAERTLLVRLDGPRLLAGDGEVIAELDDGDGCWYTPAGLPCDGVSIPALTPTPRVDESAQRCADDAWLAETLTALRRLLGERPTVTSDDVWAIALHPPREPRMVGNLFARAKSAGLMAPTDEHRPSDRPINHGRPVRVWSSLIHAQTHAR